MKGAKNILLIDDHLVVRKGVEMILNEKLESVNIYNSENYDEALEVVKAVEIDVVFLDININGVENIKIMQELKKIQPNVKILVFTSHDEKLYGMRYLKYGADGFLNKFCESDKIIEVVDELLVKGYSYSEEMKNKLEKKKSKSSGANPIDDLSNREYEIAKMLVSGLGNLEIANKLEIKMSTVSTYKTRIFEKLSISNVLSLADLFKD